MRFVQGLVWLCDVDGRCGPKCTEPNVLRGRDRLPITRCDHRTGYARTGSSRDLFCILPLTCRLCTCRLQAADVILVERAASELVGIFGRARAVDAKLSVSDAAAGSARSIAPSTSRCWCSSMRQGAAQRQLQLGGGSGGGDQRLQATAPGP